jgi:hypothetical protein
MRVKCVAVAPAHSVFTASINTPTQTIPEVSNITALLEDVVGMRKN